MGDSKETHTLTWCQSDVSLNTSYWDCPLSFHIPVFDPLRPPSTLISQTASQREQIQDGFLERQAALIRLLISLVSQRRWIA